MTLYDDSIHISQLPPRFREILDKGLRHCDQVREETGGDADYSFAILDELEQLIAEEEARAERRHALRTWQGEQDLIELRAEDMVTDDADELRWTYWTRRRTGRRASVSRPTSSFWRGRLSTLTSTGRHSNGPRPNASNVSGPGLTPSCTR